MYFISNKFLRIRGGSKSLCTNAIFFALVQELIDHPSYIKKQLLEHDAYISCLQLKKVNVAHDALHYNNYLYNHTAYYHVLQQVIAFLVYILLKACLHRLCNLFATGSRLEKKLKSRRGCKGRGKVFFKSPTSRRLKSVASCLLNMHKRLAATEFDREEVA